MALMGYISVLAASPTGHGLRLLGHLVRSHSVVSAMALSAERGAFERHDEAGEDGVSPGPSHSHRGVVHTHSSRSPSARSGQSAQKGHRGSGDVHEHDGIVHSHEAPPPAPAVVMTVSLDKHRLPDADQVEALRPSLEEIVEASEERGLSAEIGVETPPPIGCSERALA